MKEKTRNENAFDGLCKILGTAEEKINDLEVSVGTYETTQRDRMKSSDRICRNHGTITKGVTYT